MPFFKIGMFVLMAASTAGRPSLHRSYQWKFCQVSLARRRNSLTPGISVSSGLEWRENDSEAYRESPVSAGDCICSEAAVTKGKVLTDEAYGIIAEKVREQDNKSWAREMVPVESGRDGLVWIKKENKPR